MDPIATGVAATLQARYIELAGMLAGLPPGGSVSEGGRSMSVSAAEIEQQMATLEKRLAAWGISVGGIGDPAIYVTRGRA